MNGALRSYAYDRASLYMRSGNRRSYAISGTGTGGALGFRLAVNGVRRGGCSLGSFSNAFFNRIVYKRVTAMDYVYNALGFRLCKLFHVEQKEWCLSRWAG